MAFVGYDHQNSSLTDALIDEFDFLKCSQFDTSILHLNDWRISDNPNGSITIGGLRSLCLNSCQFVDKVDRVGRTLYLFDGLFDFEREKETFYVEVLIRRLTSQNKLLGIFEECQITRILATIRKTLDDFGRNHKLPRSAVAINKDFTYMHGRKGANDDCNKSNSQAWPCRSLFNSRSSYCPTLNPTSSLMVKKNK